jgi:antirestriction protein ArdC
MDVYSIVTQRITDQLASGTVPWHRPWKSGGPAGAPRNLASGRPYRGVNVFLLSSLGYASPYFVTYKQALERGGHVKQGEHGAPVVFWKWLDKRGGESQDGDETSARYAILRYYTVFNVSQCDGVTAPAVPTTAADVAPIEAAECIVAAMPDRPEIVHGGEQAYYRPSWDRVTMPERRAFDGPEPYYSTLFHELTHATGHETALEASDAHGSLPVRQHELLERGTGGRNGRRVSVRVRRHRKPDYRQFSRLYRVVAAPAAR